MVDSKKQNCSCNLRLKCDLRSHLQMGASWSVPAEMLDSLAGVKAKRCEKIVRSRVVRGMYCGMRVSILHEPFWVSV